jgi:hypothetical protein
VFFVSINLIEVLTNIAFSLRTAIPYLPKFDATETPAFWPNLYIRLRFNYYRCKRSTLRYYQADKEL